MGLLQVQACGYSVYVFVQLLPFISENKGMPRDKANLFLAFSQDKLLRQQMVYPEPIKKGKKQQRNL